MKKREMYDKKIQINEDYWMRIDKNDDNFVNLYKKETCVEHFKLNRKIYTLFKVIQDHIKEEDYIIVEDNQAELYCKEIYLYEDIYMKVNADRACLTLDFYRKNNQGTELVYLTKLIYTTQKLFYMMLIPKKLETVPQYRIIHVFKFLDMMEVLRYETNKNLKA